MFILPYNILSGGLASIVILLKPFIPNLNETLAITILDILFFIVGFIFLGKEFASQTFLSVVTYPIFLYLITENLQSFEMEAMLAAIYGGVISGIGIGLVIRQGGSTGGMDVPPLIFSKFTGVNPAVGIMFTDALTVIFGLLVYGPREILIGLLAVYFSAFAIEKVSSIYNGNQAREIRIVSNKYQEISKEIHEKLSRGTTIISAKGGFTDEDRPNLLVVVPVVQYEEVLSIINKYDKEAFVIVTETKDVKGEGFTFTSRV